MASTTRTKHPVTLSVGYLLGHILMTLRDQLVIKRTFDLEGCKVEFRICILTKSIRVLGLAMKQVGQRNTKVN